MKVSYYFLKFIELYTDLLCKGYDFLIEKPLELIEEKALKFSQKSERKK